MTARLQDVVARVEAACDRVDALEQPTFATNGRWITVADLRILLSAARAPDEGDAGLSFARPGNRDCRGREGVGAVSEIEEAHGQVAKLYAQTPAEQPMTNQTNNSELLPNWRELVARDECPRCGEPLDTGWECAVTSKACGFDAALIATTEGLTSQ